MNTQTFDRIVAILAAVDPALLTPDTYGVVGASGRLTCMCPITALAKGGGAPVVLKSEQDVIFRRSGYELRQEVRERFGLSTLVISDVVNVFDNHIYSRFPGVAQRPFPPDTPVSERLVYVIDVLARDLAFSSAELAHVR